MSSCIRRFYCIHKYTTIRYGDALQSQAFVSLFQ